MAVLSQKNFKLMRFAGICGILGSFFVTVVVFIATLLSPWFSWRQNALSDLGVGEVALIFNLAVFLGGLLNFLFCFGIREYLDRSSKSRYGVVFLMLASLFLALVGVFTVDSSLMHALAALGFFMLAPIALLLLGYSTKDFLVRRLSLIAGSLALVAILFLPVIFVVLPFEVGFAVPEIIHGLILGIWTIYMSIKMLALN